ncbi:YesL family protein [Bacillus sp. PS06]|uniref:YesL family protein n=1 Tax=Bacillus sp. PS06 TaxID=2764176 RepID=UPI001784A7DB|nr:DUF624 domain-containing protein [Bacillus sp. PS06]MBD8069608.1 DUF624 domain-containing protein [Bacillus sp. PS06]
MGNTGIIGGFHRLSEWIMRFSVSNILWILCNLPIVLLIVVIKYGLQSTSLLHLIIPIGILAPFVFFPATTALFASVRDWMIKDKDRPLVKQYLLYYRENYRNSVLVGLILTVIWCVWLSNLLYYQTENTILFFAFCVFGILLYVVTINVFSIMSHFQLKLVRLLRMAFVTTIGKPLLTLMIFVINVLFIYGSLVAPLFVTLFFSISLLAFLSFSIFYKLYLRVISGELNGDVG